MSPPPEAEPPALVVADLTVRFGSVTALDSIDLEVPRGQIVAVLGPNGAGKSTLFRAVTGLVPLEHGTVTLGAGRVAFVPQGLSVEPAFPVTVTEVVRMGRYGDLGLLRRFDPRDEQLVADAIAALELEQLADARFGDCSSGERQRALLAQAAAQDPDLFLLDEPFTGVDAPTREAVRGLTRRWRDDGKTIMVATHDLESAARDYDLVLCLNGRVAGFGQPDDVLSERILAETFAGRIARVGEMVVDVAHHHHGAG